MEDDNFDEPKKELDEQVKEEANVSGDEQKPGPSRYSLVCSKIRCSLNSCKILKFFHK